jgi:glucose-6-phosphate 1-dehydrogenase
VRDVVQNHLLQVTALVAMELPATFEADDVRDEKLKLLRSVRPLAATDAVHGQYVGYLEEPGVAKGSRTPTFAALRLFVDNWRWQGVPFYVRAGKGLARRTTEVAVHFQQIPFCLFGREDVCQLIEPNVLVLRIQPDEGIALSIATKVPGDDLTVGTVRMDFAYADAFGRPSGDAYEKLLLDAMRGDATLFARRDGDECAWGLLAPVLEGWDASGEEPFSYERGSEGPAAATELLRRDGRRWRPLRAASG